MINLSALEKNADLFADALPFPYCVIDNFFDQGIAQALEKEFPLYDDPLWHQYENAIEVKKTLNVWNQFPPLTYHVFHYLNSPEFVALIGRLFKIDPLFPDPGLHGGGWHIHKAGGKLNTHLDYSIHPKVPLQRKLNLLIYLNSDWQVNWGGHLGFWSHDEKNNQPKELMKEIEPVFNRAVFFDTTMNSWHGLPEPIQCPENQYRKALAVYYLTSVSTDAAQHQKALFTPYKEQNKDPAVLELIKKRSAVETASNVYKEK
jgi:hypothetical protein